MDFLEGALLGPLWSDTDYSTRPHRLLTGMYMFLMYAIVFALISKRLDVTLFKNLVPPVWLALTVLFMVISTFLASKYYNYGIYVRFSFLAIIFVKYVFASVFFVSLFKPIYNLNIAEIKDFVINTLNSTMGDFVSKAATQFRIMGLIISGMISMILLLVFLLLILLVIIYIPILYLKLIRITQNFLDGLLMRSKISI